MPIKRTMSCTEPSSFPRPTSSTAMGWCGASSLARWIGRSRRLLIFWGGCRKVNVKVKVKGKGKVKGVGQECPTHTVLLRPTRFFSDLHDPSAQSEFHVAHGGLA